MKTMRRKIILLLTLLLVSDDVFGKNGNKTNKQTKRFHKTNNNDSKHKFNARVKRSLSTEKILLSNKDVINEDSNQYNYLDNKEKTLKLKSIDDQDSPFWGNRGRRESSSDETVPDVQLPNPKYKQNKNLYKVILNLDPKFKDEVSPFWSNRGRRSSDESKDDDPPEDFFWANRGRRQDDDPFWGTRGRRQDDENPFWGNRGRRDNLISSFSSSKDRIDDEEPFWGNRGRRQEQEPFWGNRGRRDSFETLIHGKNKLKSLYLYKDVINNKNELKDSVIDAISDLKNNNGNYERNRRDDHTPFWINRGRDSKLKSLFNGIARNRMEYNPNTANNNLENEPHTKTFQQNTVHDDRIYAEEPHYILVERSSRSSAEDDPFFITRGKKHSSYMNKATRGRRGALEELVKSVRNDPYYIARGKKDYINVGKSNATQIQFLKTRDLICATVELLTMKYSEGNKVKRQAIDNDRDRRTILKKLALQLQMDPYFVSRGKKDDVSNIDTDALEQFINKVIVLCN
ncbi:uncharacterized protein LOC112044541 [Bicyclus anynana]|uniref:Uncharacterized protein LOC112044541 n=1 Tax=Bicyclus anynana TaxID=110368 RepID=A0ABM3LZ73_BICAN|nr:uncharacterized protein LOC112044541 [Bicyclus anynana]